MSDAISTVFAATVNDGQLDALKAVMSEMVESSRAEPGTLFYEWFLSEDGTTVHVYERYADNEAILAHFGGFGQFAERLMSAVTPVGFDVYGEVNDSVREFVVPFGAVHYKPLGGFAP